MTEFSSGYLEIPLTGNVSSSGGGIAAIPNPEGKPLIVQDVKLYVKTPSTGEATVNIGTAANATTSSSNLANLLAISGSISGKAYQAMGPLSSGDEAVVWGPTQYLTVSGSADSTGFTGQLFVRVIRV